MRPAQPALDHVAIIGVVRCSWRLWGSWVLLGTRISPLENITETVDQINRADDLSRRIPTQGQVKDESATSCCPFNQTLERLEALFTSQQRFLADVSHELRTPLTVIKGNVDLIRRMKEADEESLNSIDQEAGRLDAPGWRLLMLAQAESGKLPLNFGRVELDLLLTEVFTEMRVLAGSKVQVHLNDIDQVIVHGDRDRLKQVLLNLVANAIQYTPQAGNVPQPVQTRGSGTPHRTGHGTGHPWQRICPTSSTASIARRNRARVQDQRLWAGACPLRIGSSNSTTGRSRSSQKRGRDDVCDLVEC
jgi:two-component system, OmpR family, sensor kinase